MRAVGQTGFASLSGTMRLPVLALRFSPNLPHPTLPGLSMLEWVKKELSGARWDPQDRLWTVTGLNSPTPTQVLHDAGIVLDWDGRPAEFAALSSLDELAVPVAKLVANRRQIMVRPRLAGFDHTRTLAGSGSVWDSDRQFFRIDAADAIIRQPDGTLIARPGILWPQDALDEAFARHAARPVAAEHDQVARDLSTMLRLDGDRDGLARSVGLTPWPADGREPFDYQVPGALSVALGRRGLFDEPGVGKTASSLYASRLLDAKRTLVVVPPLLTTNWAREIEYAHPGAEVAAFRAGRKEPDLPDTGYVVIGDSLLAARKPTQERISAWAADVMIIDEAHRLKTIGSKRSDAVLDVAQSVRHAPIVLTGTPIFKSPHEMVPLLELSRMMAPVFGGRSAFLDTFCIQDNFGGWNPRNRALPQLHATLKHHVWVRRRKADVLPGLPPKIREGLSFDVPLKGYREAHKEVIAKIKAWLTWFTDQNGRTPDEGEITEWAKFSSFTLISQLRQAAGVAKMDVAADLIRTHLEECPQSEDGTWPRPLIVWVHHKSVAAALLEAVEKAGAPYALIAGATSDQERDAIVDAFQEGRVPVLIASIVKAGVGLTLTRGSDQIFAETSWNVSDITQCEDRQHRPGQEAESISIRTLIARGTLDESLQKVLERKQKTLELALGDAHKDSLKTASDDWEAISDIVQKLVNQAVREHRKESATRREPVGQRS